MGERGRLEAALSPFCSWESGQGPGMSQRPVVGGGAARPGTGSSLRDPGVRGVLVGTAGCRHGGCFHALRPLLAPASAPQRAPRPRTGLNQGPCPVRSGLPSLL